MKMSYLLSFFMIFLKSKIFGNDNDNFFYFYNNRCSWNVTLLLLQVVADVRSASSPTQRSSRTFHFVVKSPPKAAFIR